jgi:hypothetical protein
MLHVRHELEALTRPSGEQVDDEPGPVWLVAAFAQGFTAKAMPAGNRPIP